MDLIHFLFAEKFGNSGDGRDQVWVVHQYNPLGDDTIDDIQVLHGTILLLLDTLDTDTLDTDIWNTKDRMHDWLDVGRILNFTHWEQLYWEQLYWFPIFHHVVNIGGTSCKICDVAAETWSFDTIDDISTTFRGAAPQSAMHEMYRQGNP